jgi:hypothetical protein
MCTATKHNQQKYIAKHLTFIFTGLSKSPHLCWYTKQQATSHNSTTVDECKGGVGRVIGWMQQQLLGYTQGLLTKQRFIHQLYP